MIYKQPLLGWLGNAGYDAYQRVIDSGGTIAQAEAASRNASSSQTTTTPTPTPTAPVVTAAPQPIIQNTADPYPIQTLQPAQPTRQTIQPVTSNADPTPQVVTTSAPAVIDKTVNPVIPTVNYSTDSSQYSLTQMAAGPGIDVPSEYQTQDVVATPDAPVVTSVPWGLLLTLAGAAYESFKK